ncbi:GRAM domain-containing protein 4-like isoform X2 [Symsagittifera roscoffensis]|uniref:GRAM domain-containing protein 4-like isoform X2 n=1 Tax=Symsagittifera roscoffensis TaxID=84072 RepID=UPI00307C6A0B
MSVQPSETDNQSIGSTSSDLLEEPKLRLRSNSFSENRGNIAYLAESEKLKVEIEILKGERDKLRNEVQSYLNNQTETEQSANLFGFSYEPNTQLMKCVLERSKVKMNQMLFYFEKDDNKKPSEVAVSNRSRLAKEELHEDLSAQKLKENILRVRTALVPFSLLLSNLSYVSSWNNPIISINAMGVYFYLVYNQKLLIALYAILLFFFTLSYVVKCGYKVTSMFDDPEIIVEPKQVFRDKVRNVLSAVMKIQTEGGFVADALEKTISFYQWEDVEGCKRLVIALSAKIAGLIFLPNGVAQQIALCLFGFIFFIERPLFQRFPRLKKKFSFASKLWSRLPNRAEKEQRRIAQTREEAFLIHDLDSASLLSLAESSRTQRSRNASRERPSASASNEMGSDHPRIIRSDQAGTLQNSSNTEVGSPSSSRRNTSNIREILKINSSLKKLLEMYQIDDQPIPQFAEGLGCYYSQRRSIPFGLPRLVAGKLFLTENHLVFCGKFLKKESFLIDIGAIRNIELKAAEKVSNWAQTIEIHTEEETFNLHVVMSKDKTQELYTWLKSQVADFGVPLLRDERSSTGQSEDTVDDAFLFPDSMSETETN